MTRVLTIPLAPYRSVELQVPDQNLTEADWATLIAVLDAMRPALVEPDPVPIDAETDDDPLRLTPDEAIEIVLILRDYTAGSGTVEIRGTSLPALADRLDAHERTDG